MAIQQEKGKIIQEVVAYAKDKGLPKTAIVRYILDKYPLYFTDYEQVRSLVRFYTGSTGYKARQTKMKTYKWGDLPESHAETWNQYKIKFNKPLILSDIHIPYQDNRALDTAINYGINNRCDGVILNGDTLDMYQISRYEKRPDKPSVGIEFENGRQLIKVLRKTFKNIVYKTGNHEDRWIRFLQSNPIFGIDNFKLQTLLELKENEYVDSKTVIKAGKLNIIHGHELSKGASSPVSFSRTVFNKMLESTMAGHLHQVNEFTDVRQPSGELITCWALGTLGDLHPDYAPLAKWSHGVAMVEVEKNGDYHVENRRIKNGKLY